MGFLNNILKIFLGNKSKKDLKSLYPIVSKINSYSDSFSKISNNELRQKTRSFKLAISKIKDPFIEKISLLKNQISSVNDIDEKEKIYVEIDNFNNVIREKVNSYLDEILPEAFAVIKETAKRFKENEKIEVEASPFDIELSSTKNHIKINGNKAIWSNSWDAAGKSIKWDMVHYDVQLIGGIVMHQGKIAEMQTGEGKTLVATLPVYLNSLSGNGVHLVTVNDYLAKRDSAWMGPIFEFHGLSVDCIDYHKPNSESRRKAYLADITYGTNNEFGFDYLRDNMAHSIKDLVQRKHNFAIVDEVDSVLIDDARTPLIISGQVPDGDKHEFKILKPQISELVTKQKQKLINTLSIAKKLISEGNNDEGGVELLRAYRGLPKSKALIKFLSQEGVRQILQKTESYYMQDNNKEMPKIDSELFFVIDEKNNQIELTDKGVENLSTQGKDENFFVLPDLSSEIARIDKLNLKSEEESIKKEKLLKEFGIKSERIHSMTQLLKAYTLFEKDVSYVVVDNQVKIVDEQTGRIMEGRRYSDGLHQAIEAKENVKIEAATQTFATITLQNYFRMYEKLSGMTGTAITESGEFWEIYKLDVIEIPTNKFISRNDENDLVYKTKREKYNAVINYVESLSNMGRPVLIGTTSVEISELLSRMLDRKKINHNVLNAKLHKKEADVVAEAGKAGIVTIATNMAGRGTDIKINEIVKNNGGLAIIGTERHDSRRVDRQLRGRSGRQGDPGSSQFYVSLEDNLMRLFGSERMAKLMDRMGLKEGEVIQHSMITKSIERAQKKVEENNFGIRKRLLEYDDVMNSQREVIYKRRFNALFGERLQVDIANMLYDTCSSICETYLISKDFKQFEFELIKVFSFTSPVSQEEFNNSNIDELTAKLYKLSLEHYKTKTKTNSEIVFPVVRDVYQNPSNKFLRIIVPFTDGVKTINVVSNLKDAYESKGETLIRDFEKNISLAIIDESWKEHLRKMDELKQSVQLAVHEQKDPLLIYKFESFELFNSFVDKVNKEIISFLFKGELPSKDSSNIREAKNLKTNDKVNTSKEEVLNQDQLAMRRATQQNQGHLPKVETIVRQQPKIGRNQKVLIKNISNGEEKELKFKQAEVLIKKGDWVLIKQQL
uniref:Protein translocase subunit SecA n=1 Tax=uncultured Flavobacteriia bacterium TaxID=212695 RepID=F4MMJ3_9BACT|nr:preprotein translocase subunit SecA [uncultured bacterium]CBL87356.1 protein translocase, SecA subunit [uncultured Flavobacteriia bacterium]